MHINLNASFQMKELSIGVLIRIVISYYFVTDLVENLMTAEMYYMCLNVETLLSLFDTCVAGIYFEL